MTLPRMAAIAADLVSPDSSQPLMPVSAFDQAVAALAERPNALTNAFTCTRMSGGLPIDRLSKLSALTSSVAPSVIAADAGFPMRAIPLAPATISPATIDLSVSSTGFRAAAANYTQSYTVVLIFRPTSTTGPGGIVGVQGSAAGTGAGIYGMQMYCGGSIGVNATLGGEVLASSTRTGKINESGANIIVVCGDATTRQVALYVNSKTPILSAVGVGPNPWPLPVGGIWGLGAAFGASAAVGCRVRDFVTFNRSLYHDVAGLPKLAALIQAAADTYGITLL